MLRWHLVKMRLGSLDRWGGGGGGNEMFCDKLVSPLPLKMKQGKCCHGAEAYEWFSVWGPELSKLQSGGGRSGAVRKAILKMLNETKSAVFKNENSPTLIFQDLYMALKTIAGLWNLFTSGLSPPSPHSFSLIFLLWELFLIKNCHKLFIGGQGGKKKVSTHIWHRFLSTEKNHWTFEFFSFLFVNDDIRFRWYTFFQTLRCFV